MASPDMAKAYDPSLAETKWYPRWEKRGYFAGKIEPGKEPYTIVIPPPNVTGMLTLGHVLNNTLQDILIRFEKMRGKSICWVPGTDHAGIATQAKVEAMLREEEGLTRRDLGREAFLARVWEWKEKYGGTIIRQLRSLGTACDWERERFTLDQRLSEAVEEVFVRLYEKGLIYRGTRLINWCPKTRTALSDEEVYHQTVKGHLWHIRYPFSDGSGHLVVATTRPETMLGDTAVAVNPQDERFQALIGKKLRLPLAGREIPVIADDWVKPEFGTGAVKVTPAHDPNDYEIGQRHGLEMINIFNDDATMNEAAGEDFVGMDRYECRESVVQQLTELGLLVKVDEYTHEVGYSERGHVAVEPRISAQWFVKMKTLAEPAIEAVNSGRIHFHPERWVKTYNHWMENIRDWCISRQLWWGHRIPAYYCQSCEHIEVSRETPTRCSGCGGTELRQDEDVLDTWFSSWLWPFSVFDWPHDNPDLRNFYPTQTLVTGPDIIFFWVARMIMAGLEFRGEIPFSNVYFTSIIRDADGRKMSKSLGNSPDPIDVIAEFGADALRYTVIYLAPVGTDIRYSNDKCELGRNFANKLWNAARFRQIQGEISPDWANLDGLDKSQLRPDDRWILARADAAIRNLTTHLDQFDFHAYALQLYDFVWSEFCDWYVESAKSAFYGESEERKRTTLRIFDHVYGQVLRLMHPVMPFVTEELYHNLGYVGDEGSVMLADWPRPLEAAEQERLGLDPTLVELVAEKFRLVRAGRNLRSAYNIPMAQKIDYFLKPTDAAFQEIIERDPASMQTLLNASKLTIDAAFEPEGSIPSAVEKHGLVYMPLTGLIDIDAELARLDKQRDELLRGLSALDNKLSNDKFVSKAPAEVVQRERQRQRELREKFDQVQALMSDLSRQR